MPITAKNSKTPLYFQLKEQIKSDILGGKYKEGDLLPSEREFQQHYNISSTTIRRALNDLVQDHYLERKPGRGTFVKLPKITRNLRKVIGFTRNILEMGMTPVTKVLSLDTIPANLYSRERLGLKKEEKIYQLKRLRFANETPILFEERYIRADLCPSLEEQNLTSSLWHVFESVYGMRPIRHLQSVTLTEVTAETAGLLQIPAESTAFLIRGMTYISDNTPIECEQSIYRTDKYDLTFEAELD